MTTPLLLEQAKDGDATAIAALLTHALKSKDITVRGDRQSYCLRLWLTGATPPPQMATVTYVQRALGRLQLPDIGIVEISGSQTGAAQPAWTEEISLLAIAADNPDPSPPQPFAPCKDGNFPPPPVPLAPTDREDQATPVAVARAYQVLGLALGEPLPQVEAVYFKRRAELLRQGDRAALEPLKWAFTTLKNHLEQSAILPGQAANGDRSENLAAIATARPGVGSVSRSQPRQAKPQADRLALADDTDILSFQNRYSNGLIFPGLLLLGMLMNAMPIVNALLWGIKIWIHEFGHATVAWLAGRQALPLPIGWTSYNPQRSVLVYLAILVLLGLLFWAGRRENQRWPMVLATVLAVVQFYMTWLLSADRFDMLMAFGGVGGEIYLAALLIVSFYFPLPNYFRWDFYRFPVVLGAAFCFWGQVWLWQQVPKGKASIPFGSLWGEAEHGDMNQLIDIHGWMPGDIIGTYGTLTHLCLLGIVGVYAYTLFRQHRETFVALGRQWLP